MPSNSEMSPNQVPGSTYVSVTCLPDSDTELTRTAPSATPHHSSAGAPRAERIAPSCSRRTTARDRIASRSGGESLENHGPDSMFDCSSIVRIGGCMPVSDATGRSPVDAAALRAAQRKRGARFSRNACRPSAPLAWNSLSRNWSRSAAELLVQRAAAGLLDAAPWRRRPRSAPSRRAGRPASAPRRARCPAGVTAATTPWPCSVGAVDRLGQPEQLLGERPAAGRASGSSVAPPSGERPSLPCDT